MTIRILITGAGGYVGKQLGESLCAHYYVRGVDLREVAADFPITAMDIRDRALGEFMREHRFTHVVHLAAVLEDSGDRARDFDIDVNGTANVLDACVQNGVKHLTVTSSGAAYGYHADNPQWLKETDALRGNVEFAYSDHKRQVEEMLARYRQQAPELAQLVLRVGTVLGANTRNLITNLFQRPRLLAVSGSHSPFVFIWDKDLLAIIEQGVRESVVGIFNVAGDGVMTMADIGAVLHKPVLTLPAWLIQAALAIGKSLGLTRYGPAQVKFLRYRPVLDNHKLKTQFAFTPQKTSAQTFDWYAQHAQQRGES